MRTQVFTLRWVPRRCERDNPVAIASYLGNRDAFDRAISEFAAAYADQNQRDYESVAAAAKAGVIPVDESEAVR